MTRKSLSSARSASFPFSLSNDRNAGIFSTTFSPELVASMFLFSLSLSLVQLMVHRRKGNSQSETLVAINR